MRHAILSSKKSAKHFLSLYVFVLAALLSVSSHAATKKIGIIVFDGVLTSDVTAPIEVFGAASKQAWFSNYEVTVISSTKDKSVTSEEGLQIQADKTIYDKMDLDVLLVGSAYDMDPHLNNKDLIAYVEKAGSKSSWMASNCSGSSILAKAGLLDGKRATTWAGGEADFAKAFPKVDVQYDQNVVVDEGVITSNGGPVSYESAFTLLSKLSSEKYSKEISDYIQFSRLERTFK